MKSNFTFSLAAILLVSAVSSGRADKPTKDIVETAIAAGNFSTLASALKAADLVDALKGEGPFTVFAPTDEAFAKLPKETVESLLKPENKEKLVAILKYHVVLGKVTSKEVVKLTEAKTLPGVSREDRRQRRQSDGRSGDCDLGRHRGQ